MMAPPWFPHPLAGPSSMGSYPETMGTARAVASAITVLVVDDEEDLRMLARLVLERAGFEVVEEALDGPAALEAVARLAPPPIPAVMLLDNQMPGLTGLEVAEQVLAFVSGQHIILFSAFLDAD